MAKKMTSYTRCMSGELKRQMKGAKTKAARKAAFKKAAKKCKK